MSAVWHGAIFGFDYLADQYNASRWHWRQWGMHKFQYPKFSGKLFGSMWKMLVMSALDLVILSQLVGLFPGAYWGIPGNYMVIIIRTIIVLPVGIKFSLWTRSLTHFSTSAKRLEIIKNVSFTLISTVFSAWFIQLDGTALFVALYSIAYKVVSEFVTFRIDTRHPPAANIFIAPDKKLAESPDEMVINGTRVHRMEIAEVIERMLAQGQAGLKTKYGFDIGSRKTYEAFLKNSERALDFLIEDGSRFDTNNPAHVRRLVAFIEQSLRAAGISEDVWALDAQRFGKRAERPQEILEFSREVPQLHEKLIEDRRLRDIITYGNLFEGSAAWDDVPSEFEERNLPIAAWVKDEPFRDRAFWSSLEQADFAKQKFEFVVADREYFARAGKLSLLEAQKEKVIDDRISGQQLIIPHQGGDPFELMLQMIKGFLWHHYLNSPVIDTLMKEKAAEQFGQAFIYGYIDSFSFVTPINSSKKIMGGFIAGKALEIVSAMEFRPSMLRRDIVQIEPSREKLWQAYFADAHNSRRNRFVFSKKFDTTKSIPVKLVGLFEFWREKKKAADFMAELNNPSMIPFLEGIIGLPIRGLVSYIFSKTAIESVIVKQGLSAADIDCEGIIRQVIVAEAAAGNIRELFFEALKEYGVDFATGKAVRPRAPDGVLKQADGGIQLMLGAQDGYPYWQKYGNLVGAITFNQLKDMGVQYVFIHHSGLPLPDHLVRQKTFEAISNEITPIICLWETREDIDKDRAFPAIHKQLNRLVKPLGQHVQKVVLAYEPLWIVELALLRGYFTPAPAEEVEKMHLYIRDYLAQNAGSAPFADSVPIIAGPGASAGNAAEYMSRTSVDGLAVGAASVDPESFAQIVLNGAAHASTEKTPIFIANLKQENIACGIKQYWAEVETRLQGAVNDSRVVICPNMVDLVRISEKDGGAGQTTFDDFGQLALNVGNVRFHTTEYHRTFRSAIEKETWETYASWSDKYLWWMTFVVYSQDKGFYATVKVAPVANPRRQEKLSRYNYEGIVVINIETMDPQINSQALYAALMGRGLLGKSVSMLAPEIKKRRLFDWVQDGNIAYIINGRFISVNGTD
ncbi:MAG: triose-phosphate isomerase [Candidatus Omnitrophica bacterium]|nr:triose-phosphate isomerase [Candidatus Omnitrophota bacterium]